MIVSHASLPPPFPARTTTRADGSRSARPLLVTISEIACAYGDFRWGINLGVHWGINLGYRLERHPQHPTKPQRTPHVRGSAATPDSLGHKRDYHIGWRWPGRRGSGSPES